MIETAPLPPYELIHSLSYSELFNLCFHDIRNLLTKIVSHRFCNQPSQGDDVLKDQLPLPKVELKIYNPRSLDEKEILFVRSFTPQSGHSRSVFRLPSLQTERFITELKNSLAWERNQLRRLVHQEQDRLTQEVAALGVFLVDASLFLLNPDYRPFVYSYPPDFNPYEAVLTLYNLSLEQPSNLELPWDPRLIAIFTNLIHNASKQTHWLQESQETPAKPALSLQEKDGQLVLAITNPALLSPQEEQKLSSGEVFKIGVSSQGGRHGYGLAICQILAHQLGGSLQLKVEKMPAPKPPLSSTEKNRALYSVEFTLTVPLASLRDVRYNST